MLVQCTKFKAKHSQLFNTTDIEHSEQGVLNRFYRVKIEETKKIGWKKIPRVENFLLFLEQKLSRVLDLAYALAETFTGKAKKCENRESFCPRKFLPLKYYEAISSMVAINCILHNYASNYGHKHGSYL